jgi:Protein of unknown function (DUF4199)
MGIFNNPNRIPENYGLKMAAGMILFFLAMRLLDLHHHVELRLLNLLIQSVGIYYALKQFRTTHSDHLNYFRGLIVGVATGSVGSAVFAAFMFAYMQLDAGLMQSIIDNEPMGHYLNPYISSFIVALEGGFSSMLVTFLLLNYIGTDDVNDPAGESK